MPRHHRAASDQSRAPAHSDRRSATVSASGGRRAGSFSRHPSTSASSARGINAGARADGGRGAVLTWSIRACICVPPWNARGEGADMGYEQVVRRTAVAAGMALPAVSDFVQRAFG